MDLRITVNKGKKSKPVSKPQQQERRAWPVAPFEDDDVPKFMLDLSFYDGSSEPDPANIDGSGYRIMDVYDNFVEADHESTVSTFGSGRFTFNFKQNKPSETDDTDIEDTWTLPEDSTPRDVFDRRVLTPFEDDDLENNDEVLPCGALKSNIKVEIMDESGSSLGSVTALEILKGEVAAFWVPEFEGLAYRWFSPPPGGHIKITEITANAHYILADSGYGGLWRQGDIWYADRNGGALQKPSYRYVFEGVFWHWFDTSDSDTFKITTVPRYDCEPTEEQTGPVLVMRSSVSAMRVFLIPRQWWVFFRFSEGDTDTMIGQWGLCPRDFLFGPPRKTGVWEGNHPWEDFPTSGGQIEGDDLKTGVTLMEGGTPFPPDLSYTESNCRQATEMDGDSEDDNGFYLLQKAHRRSPNAGLWPAEEDPATLIGHYEETHFADIDSFGSFYGTDDPADLRRFVSLYPEHHYGTWGDTAGSDENIIEGSDNLELQESDGFWGSVSDGKIPTMLRSIRLSVGDGGYNYWDRVGFDVNQVNHEGGYATRDFLVLDESLLPEDGVAAVQTIIDKFLETDFCDRPGETPSAYMVAMGAAREKELVGIIEQNGEALFVWRREGQEEKPKWKWTGDESDYMLGTDEELVVGALPWDSDTHGYRTERQGHIACVDISQNDRRLYNSYTWGGPWFWLCVAGGLFGHIELEDYEDVEGPYEHEAGTIMRFNAWGKWIETASDSKYFVEEEHKNVIELDRYCLPVLYHQTVEDRDMFMSRVLSMLPFEDE